MWKSTSELGRVDGVGRPQFDFHAGRQAPAAAPPAPPGLSPPTTPTTPPGLRKALANVWPRVELKFQAPDAIDATLSP